MSEANIPINQIPPQSREAVYPLWGAKGAGTLAEVFRLACSMPALLGAALVSAMFLLERSFFVDPDMWWHLKTGELILSTHRWTSTDSFSFTATGGPRLSYEWLGDVLLAMSYRLGGLRALDALLIVLAASVVVALYGFATVRSTNCKAAFAVSILLIPLAAVSFNLRPQMLGYLFLILTLIALERFRQGKQRAVWMLPFLFLIWINTHGSWIIGLLTVAVYLASGLVNFRIGNLEAHRWTNSERLRLEIVFLLSLVAIPITPYGTEIAAYPFTVATSVPLGVASVQEWRPMPFDIISGKVFLALLLGFFLTQVVFRFAWRLEEFFLFLFGTAMACLHVRFLMLFVPFFAPIAAVVLARWTPPYYKARDQYLINFAVMAGIVFAMFYYLPPQSQIEKNVASRYPVRALQYLREHPVPGPLFNTYGYGGYMIESGFKTFIDGRSEVFEQMGVLADYMYIKNLRPGTLRVLQGYGIRSVLMGRGEPLLTVLAASPDWRRVYSDGVSELYVKKDADDARKEVIVEPLPSSVR